MNRPGAGHMFSRGRGGGGFSEHRPIGSRFSPLKRGDENVYNFC